MMEDIIDYDKLIEIVKNSVKKSYHVYVDSKGKPLPNVANLGAVRGDVAKLERRGEYHGIAVEFLENALPVLTDAFVIRICTMLKKEDYITPLTILKLKRTEELRYILHTWFSVATTEYENEIDMRYTTSVSNFSRFDEWINTVTHDPILVRIKIVEIGQNQNTGNSVVPAEWLDREFANGREVHAAMDKLETRLNKPPVTYAIINSMIIQKHDTLLKTITGVSYTRIFYVELSGSKLKVKMVRNTDVKKSDSWSYVKYGPNVVGFHLDEILVQKKSQAENQYQLREVGLLVSRLQKSIRRGRYASRILSETIDALNDSPNYNLPEHGFLRVSSAKQLVWRLFISILEDCRTYEPVNELSLLDLILLVLITQKCQEYKFTVPVLKAIKYTALLAQANDLGDDVFNWREVPTREASKTPIVEKSDFQTAISLALRSIIMMKGDAIMLKKMYNFYGVSLPFTVPTRFVHRDDVYQDVFISSVDPHSNTHIILYYQACRSVGMSTRDVSGYIWDTSSSYNVRRGRERIVDPLLQQIQLYFASNQHRETVHITTKKTVYDMLQLKKIPTKAKRISFLLLFGKKYATKVEGVRREVIIAGTSDNPLKIKIDNVWTSDQIDKSHREFVTIADAYPKQTVYLNSIDPPIGYAWTVNKVETSILGGKPYINSVLVPYFDASSIMTSTIPVIDIPIDDKMYRMIVRVLSGQSLEFDTILTWRQSQQSEIMNWYILDEDMGKINTELVRLAYTKIFNQFNNIITIGPVDRSGNKMNNSIHYVLEGKLWAVFNLFHHLYPGTFRVNGALNFYIKKKSPGYVHLVDTLESILFVTRKIVGPKPSITTDLWDHQVESSNKILAGFNRRNQHGFGDASDVGAGKTLTSLHIAVELIRAVDTTFSGILVMLPGNKLIQTWLTEIEKHTKGFHVIVQENHSNIGAIRRNTIIITTMGRIRDHPINHNWLLVIIDECLTVQNKNALWTESAWKQSLMAKHLVMMSATFFRTRFDKLYYMLKMLQSGFPESRDYLDVILLETIVSHISSIKRKWTSNTHRFNLDTTARKLYSQIERINLDTEALYSKLTSFLISDKKIQASVRKQLDKLIKKCEESGRRCLIYARSKEEAVYWSQGLDIPIYVSKKDVSLTKSASKSKIMKRTNHIIVTYNDGTYGLNDLVIYDTIIMRPPQPDKLTQIKGRLDRPGQKSDNLFIEYFIIGDTVEEGLLIRMHIASQFIHQYIMPLARFYDISVHYKEFE